jgi:hypothetical protein
MHSKVLRIRDQQSQSMEPKREISAALRQSPITA